MTSRILGIGTDVVEIKRIRSAMRSPRFLERILRPDERCKRETAHWVAGRWAAKEAAAKALGVHLKWHDVAIVSAEDGKPTVVLFDAVRNQGIKVHLSISHERSVAIAMVVVETVDLKSATI